MSIKIHHGAHGSFKTAGAIHDDLIPAIRAGRPIVTNVRGITLDRIYEAIPDAPANLELIWIDTKFQAGRDQLARWFHWIPFGAFMLIDEAQSVFPKSWRQSDIDALDFPGGRDAAAAENRAATWNDVWDMERHYNLDIVLTTPAITKIREDIRSNAEGAFKHKNLGIYGWLFGGSYVEGFHLAEDNGKADSDFQSVVKKRIKKNDPTWQLYESTATGEHQDTLAGISIFSNPRLLLAMGAAALAIVVIASNGTPAVIDRAIADEDTAQAHATGVAVPVSQGAPAVYRSSDSGAGSVAYSAVSSQLEPVHPFEGQAFRYLGNIEGSKGTRGFFEVGGVFINSDELKKIGYRITYLAECAVMLHHGKTHFISLCQQQSAGRSEAAAERRPAQAAADSLPLSPVLPEAEVSAPPDVPREVIGLEPDSRRIQRDS